MDDIDTIAQIQRIKWLRETYGLKLDDAMRIDALARNESLYRARVDQLERELSDLRETLSEREDSY